MSSTKVQLLVAGNADSALRRTLEQFDGFTPTYVSSLAAAQAAVQGPLIDLILLDARLPRDELLDWFVAPNETSPIPILLFAPPGHEQQLVWGIKHGAADSLILPMEPVLLRARLQVHLQTKLMQEQALSTLHDFDEVERLADDLRLFILPLGIALSTETDLDRLLERILIEAMRICNADAGAISLRTQENSLRYAALRVDSLGQAYGGTTGETAPQEDLPLYDAVGEPNRDHVLTYAALEGLTINIADVYNEEGFDFSGTKGFDRENKYRTVSCLTVPLINEELIGVLQLRNAQDPQTGAVVPFDAYQQLAAESLASQVTIALHNHMLRKSEAQLLRFKRELQIGREIQAGFFPRHLPEPPGWQFAARFQAAHEVAGDFYDVFPMAHGHLGIVIADVCDKGLPAALYMALVRSLLRVLSLQHFHFAGDSGLARRASSFTAEDNAHLLDTVRLVNAYIGANHAQENVFATLFFGVLDPTSGRLIYINGGHVPPILMGAAGDHRRLRPTGPAIGLLPEGRFGTQEIEILPGETLFLFTDGVTEARDEAGAFFGEKRLIKQLSHVGEEDLSELLGAIQEQVGQHVGTDEMHDDLTMLAARRLSS